MKTLRNLTGGSSDGPERQIHAGTAAHWPNGGTFVTVTMGCHGVLIRGQGRASAFFPIEELIKLAALHEPALDAPMLRPVKGNLAK